MLGVGGPGAASRFSLCARPAPPGRRLSGPGQRGGDHARRHGTGRNRLEAALSRAGHQAGTRGGTGASGTGLPPAPHLASGGSGREPHRHEPPAGFINRHPNVDPEQSDSPAVTRAITDLDNPDARLRSVPYAGRIGGCGVATFVLVHGAMHGGWCWREVRQRLSGTGHEVYTPTLTGQGDRRQQLTRTSASRLMSPTSPSCCGLPISAMCTWCCTATPGSWLARSPSGRPAGWPR